MAVFAKENSETEKLNAALKETKVAKFEKKGISADTKKEKADRYIPVFLMHSTRLTSSTAKPRSKAEHSLGKMSITLSLFLEALEGFSTMSMDTSNLVL